MEWDTFYYWHRRAMELFYAKTQRSIKEILENDNTSDGKVEDHIFEEQRKRLYAKIDEQTGGTIDGG